MASATTPAWLAPVLFLAWATPSCASSDSPRDAETNLDSGPDASPDAGALDGDDRTDTGDGRDASPADVEAPADGGDAGAGSRDSGAVDTGPRESRLAFASNREGSYDLYLCLRDGSGLQRLTDGEANELFPSWSPDGASIVYASNPGFGFYGLLVTSVVDGTTTAVRVAGDVVQATSPSYSPDGAWIAFEGKASELAPPDIYRVPAAGGAATQLTTHAARDVGPVWSPDGSQIFFVSDRSGTYEAYVMPAAGGPASAITTSANILGRVSISRDGLTLAYVSSRPGSTSALVLRELGSGAEREIGIANDAEPSFGPEGLIAVSSSRFGDPEVVVLSVADGSLVYRVTESPGIDGAAAFSP